MFQKLTNFDTTDTRFIRVKIWLMHLEENLNGSYFARPIVEEAIPTLANTPILAFIEENDTGDIDFSDHRQVLIVNKDGFEIKYLGKAIGVIPETNNAQFEQRLCDDGETRTFLTVEGLVWTKFDEPIDILLRDKIKGQSMELHDNYEGEFKDDNLFHFTKFSFYGACGLGMDVLPAMHNATIEVNFSLDDFTKEIQSKMEEYKLNFSATNAINNVVTESEGGSTVKVKKSERIQQLFALSQEQLESQLKRELAEIETIQDSYWEDWSYPRFYFVDYYVEDKIVIAEDAKDGYRLVGFKYEVLGDNVEVDPQSAQPFKITYEPLDVSADPDNDDDAKVIIDTAATEYQIQAKERELNSKLNDAIKEKDSTLESVQAEFSNLKEKFTAIEQECNELKEFKTSKLTAERQQAENEIFDRFSEKLTDEDMVDIKTKASEMALEEIENKLFAIVGRKTTKFSASNQPQRISMGLAGFGVTNEDDKEPKNVWTEQKQKFSQNK